MGRIYTHFRMVVVKELRKRIFKDLKCTGNTLYFLNILGENLSKILIINAKYISLCYSVNFCMKNSITVTLSIEKI